MTSGCAGLPERLFQQFASRLVGRSRVAPHGAIRPFSAIHPALSAITPRSQEPARAAVSEQNRRPQSSRGLADTIHPEVDPGGAQSLDRLVEHRWIRDQ